MDEQGKQKDGLNLVKMADRDQKTEWWTKSRFGMFIHWGLYAIPAQGEWFMYAQKLPVHEYEKLAQQFNPTAFNAKAWVTLAKEAGMRYIVITAKHHDGFAMFQSKADPFNIMDASPFGRDPMKELAEACQEAGITLCFYYSHVIDWHHPHSLHKEHNNTWDYKLEEKRFSEYWEGKVKPQLRELLTEYGKIGLLWFDTAGGLSEEDSKDIVQYVRSLQPECLMNSRVSHFMGMGDYVSKGDNEIGMSGEDRRPWETPMTLNQSWGYTTRDQVWKTAESLIHKLVNVIGKGGNLLLNVGPTPEGEIPELSAQRLREVGEWTHRNAESIYGTDGSPFPCELQWGGITTRPGRLYLHIHNNKWPENGLRIHGIRNHVLCAYSLADPSKEELRLEQTYDEGLNLHTLSLQMPPQPTDAYVSVIVLELEGEDDFDRSLTQLPYSSFQLDVPLAQNSLVRAADEEAEITALRSVKWTFKLVDPGTYEVFLVSYKRQDQVWADLYPEPVVLETAGQCKAIDPKEDAVDQDSPSCQHPYTAVLSSLGKVRWDAPGTYSLTLASSKLKDPSPRFTEIWHADAVKLRAVRLVRVDEDPSVLKGI
ncbi:alpha-L-fucosidase [Paenibacillus dokdonensis]|uniref:alpha-L-fucosidase n=1 Tax=Paenibacillus dokdonensis TaxID=2567944 RepID=A0ABU6GRI6_9BACL|nr:alpha-L-fucosidase [Paenibacillus dokdonensis]MEC0242370.1 alpha-L-fucosidase [Paenibacillus dokdonensis]